MKRRNGNLITIGSFDGVHRGHWTLLDKTVLEAKKRNLVPMALTFDVPPRMVIHKYPDPSVLTTPHEKEWLIRERGIEKVEFLDFDSNLAQQKSFYFFKYGLLQKYRAKGIVVGLDFHFGVHRSGSVYDLVRWGQDFEIPVWVLPQYKWRGKVASSSWIRTLLQAKRYKECMDVMGHPYSVFGDVVKGRGMGKKLGFPTANLRVEPHKLLPPGIFAVRGWVLSAQPKGGFQKRRSFVGVCNIGRRPTLLKHSPVTVEVHSLSTAFDSKTRYLFVELLSRLRSERKFKNREALQRAIQSDIRSANLFFRRQHLKHAAK